jgi:hypothetical protein
LETDVDVLSEVAGQVFPDVVSADRKFAVTSVHKHGKPNRPWSAEIHHGIERGPNGASGEQDVVYEDNHLVVDTACWFCRLMRGTQRGLVEIIAIQGGVEDPHWWSHIGDVLDM